MSYRLFSAFRRFTHRLWSRSTPSVFIVSPQRTLGSPVSATAPLRKRRGALQRRTDHSNRHSPSSLVGGYKTAVRMRSCRTALFTTRPNCAIRWLERRSLTVSICRQRRAHAGRSTSAKRELSRLSAGAPGVGRTWVASRSSRRVRGNHRCLSPTTWLYDQVTVWLTTAKIPYLCIGRSVVDWSAARGRSTAEQRNSGSRSCGKTAAPAREVRGRGWTNTNGTREYEEHWRRLRIAGGSMSVDEKDDDRDAVSIDTNVSTHRGLRSR